MTVKLQLIYLNLNFNKYRDGYTKVKLTKYKTIVYKISTAVHICRGIMSVFCLA